MRLLRALLLALARLVGAVLAGAVLPGGVGRAVPAAAVLLGLDGLGGGVGDAVGDAGAVDEEAAVVVVAAQSSEAVEGLETAVADEVHGLQDSR